MAKKNAAESAEKKKKKKFLKKPHYEGGTNALREYVARELRYPAAAVEKRIQGDVHIRYDVNDDGIVCDAKVLRGIDHDCNEEALRLVRSLRFLPIRNRGLRTTTHLDIVIHFRLPAPPLPLATTQHPLSLSYTFVPSQPTLQEVPAPTIQQGYTWSITLQQPQRKNTDD